MSKNKLLQITKGLFRTEEQYSAVFASLCFSGEYYYLKENSVLTPRVIEKSINNTLEFWDNYSYVFIFSTEYNSSEDRKNFKELVLKYKKSPHKKKLKEYLKKAILSVKTENYLDKKSRLDLDWVEKSDFRDIWQFYNYYSPFEYNKCLAMLFNVLEILKYYSWGEVIEFLPHKFLKLMYNANFYFFEGSPNYFRKEVTSDSSDYLVALALANTIQKINEKRTKISLKPIFDIIEKLEKERQYYWLGLLISNIEYNLNRNLNSNFHKKARQLLKNKLLKQQKYEVAINDLISGLKLTQRDCHLCVLSIFNEIKVANKELAFKLAQEILKDYDEKIFSSDNYNLCMHSEKETEYCNAVLQSLIYLNNEGKIDINKIFNKWMLHILIPKDIFNYSLSLRIHTQNKVFHLFTVIFNIFEYLQKVNSSTVKSDVINETALSYMGYLNDFSYYTNNQIWFSVQNVFKLKVMKKFIDSQIIKEYNSASPNFQLMAYLLSVSKKKNKNVKEFICSYFDKYFEYWNIHKIEKWLSVCKYLGDNERLKLCISKFHPCRREALAKFYELELEPEDTLY